MSGADHLGEIDYDRFTVFSPDEDIEFVEISMNEAVFGETDDEFHQSRIQVGRRFHRVNLTSVVQQYFTDSDLQRIGVDP